MSRETTSVLARQEPVQVCSNNKILFSIKQEKIRAVRFATYAVVKRALDFVFSAVFLVALAPVFVIVAIAIKLDSPGPVFFKQKRTGKDGKEFEIFKFRSMVKDNNVYDNTCEDKNTRVGKIIRKTSIDELPQFINVLLGQMSFIGPRPWVTEYWINMSDEERGRAKVRPGITGLAAAKGRNGLTISEKIAYDLEYVANFSFWQDVKIVFGTIMTVLKQEEVDAGKGQISDDISELIRKNKRPGVRVILNDSPLTSVVVSMNDDDKSIRRAINVATGHSYDDVELAVVNDEISEEAGSMIKNLIANGVKVTDGVYDSSVYNRNRFWCFIDTGGLWRPSKVGRQIETIVKSQEKDNLVSIIVPVHNGAKYIVETIKTVKDQTYKNWELIIVDDASSDDTVSVVKKMCSSKIKLIQLAKNGGAAKARNRGVEEATGRFVCFLDADDLWEKEKLEKQVKFMQERGCAFSFTGYEFADENGKPNGKKVFVPGTITYKQALRNTTIWTSTVMFDMDRLSKFDIKMPNVASEDTATWWKVLKKVGCAYGINEVLAYYRRSSGTLSSNKIVAIQRIWNLYRKYEKLNLLKSAGNFTGYAVNAVKRRV